MSKEEKQTDLERLEQLHGKLSGPFSPSKIDQELRETITVSIADDLSFTVDQDIANLVEACWKSGIFVLQSDSWSSIGTVRLHIATTSYADQFLANICSGGDLYWKSPLKREQMLRNWHEVDLYTKIDPTDWHWSINFEFMLDQLEDSDLLKGALQFLGHHEESRQDEVANEPSVIVRFPYEFSESMTERLLSVDQSNLPRASGMIWKLLPDLSCFDSSYFF
ncbi:MAG: hypothetical protein CL398_10515 [Acidiferrobacteraceae bacterium]|nr:hypothetical protein [Acidiferrobacteraceae bacterium]